MRGFLASIAALILIACGAAEQPEWAETVHAVGIQTTSDQERSDLIDILNRVASKSGHHLDYSSKETLDAMASSYRQTVSACAWKGQEDEESLFCAMDFQDRPGLVYLTFRKGTSPAENRALRKEVLAALEERFGSLPAIPEMPNGALPLPKELVLRDGNYAVDDDVLENYERDAARISEQMN